MNGRSDDRPSSGALEVAGTPVRFDDSRHPAANSQTLVVDVEYVPRSVPVSNYGKIGEIAKRVVARLIRFHTHEQAALNDAQRKEIEHLRARLASVEASVQQRFAVGERELIRLQREHAEAVADMAAIAERMPAYENVRRTVSRMSPFRDEVRAHRRALMEIRQHFTSLSARLTLVQREIAPTRTALDHFRAELDAAFSAYQGETAVRQAELGTALAELQTNFDATFLALRRELDEALTAMRAEVQGNTSGRYDLPADNGALLERADAIFESVRREEAALSGAVAEHGARLAGVMAELARVARAVDDREPAARLAHAETRLAEFEAAIDAFTKGIERISKAEARMADVAGAVNSLSDDFIHDKEERDQLLSVLRSDTRPSESVRDELTQIAKAVPDVTQHRLADIAGRLDLLAADIANLRSRLLATPYVSTPLSDWTPARLSAPDDFDYLGFEEVFRGPEALVRERLRIYLPLLEGHVPIVELGSGRGEFLELLGNAKLEATGVEINPEAVEHCRVKDLRNVVTSDANTYLQSLAEGSLGAIFSAQFAEHLTFTDLLRCLTLSRSRLAEGGLFIAETVNPNSIEAAKTFFVDPSHVRPLFPEVFTFLCRSVGYRNVRLFYPSGGGFDEHDPAAQHEYAVVATA